MGRVLLLLALLLTVFGARAGEAQNVAADPVLEARVNALAAELRCLVCQNQTIADSHADLAVDLKNQVREQLRSGRSEQQVIDYMTQRYGDFVLYRPPFKATTVLLWAGPALLLVVGVGVFWRSLRRTQEESTAEPDISAAEAQRAAQILQGEAPRS
ncbi:MAG: cytochrome c-type biogenesis protein [Rubrivivax sp.]